MMSNKSMKVQIEIRMKEAERGTIFTINDFYDLGNTESIKKGLLRLVNDNTIYRLIDGFYVIPKYSPILQEYSYPSPDQLATKIAEKYVWKISPHGETALNLFGFSTQVSSKYGYISDGPYREYEYRNQIIKFKHTNNRNISIFTKELSLVIQVIRALGKQGVKDIHISRLAVYCKKHVKEDLKNDTKQVTAWIYDILKRIGEDKNYG